MNGPLPQGLSRAIQPKSELNEEVLKALQAQYDDWIQHPTTKQLLTLLQKREQKYVKDLTDQIQVKSDKEFEDKQRAAISTVKTLILLVSNKDEFIKHSTKRESN